MSDDQQEGFRKRIERIEKMRGAGRRGGRGHGSGAPLPRGLARQPEKHRRRLPVRALLMAAVFYLGLKTALVVWTGEALYAERVAQARDRGGAEGVGALLFLPDPVSGAIAARLQALIPKIALPK